MFSVLTSKIFGGVSIALALLLTYAIVTGKIERKKLQNNIDEAEQIITERELTIRNLRADKEELNAGIKTCNASVSDLKKLNDKIAAIGAAAVKQAQASRDAVQAKIDRINAMPTATCTNVMEILKAGGKP